MRYTLGAAARARWRSRGARGRWATRVARSCTAGTTGAVVVAAPRQIGPQTVLSDSLLKAEAGLAAGAGDRDTERRRAQLLPRPPRREVGLDDPQGGDPGRGAQVPDAPGRDRDRRDLDGWVRGSYTSRSLEPSRFCASAVTRRRCGRTGGLSAPGAFDDAEDYTANDVFAAARSGRYAGLPVWIDGGAPIPSTTRTSRSPTCCEARASQSAITCGPEPTRIPTGHPTWARTSRSTQCAGELPRARLTLRRARAITRRPKSVSDTAVNRVVEPRRWLVVTLS